MTDQTQHDNLKLHPATADLIDRFADALKEKAAAAELKYGYTDDWVSSEWQEALHVKLVEHVEKGDPPRRGYLRCLRVAPRLVDCQL